MPYYCTVPRCTSMAGKAKNVSFHQFPRDEELAKLWNKILKRGKPYTKYSKVCSLHFRPEDYTITSVGKNKGQWRTLRKDAIPSQNLPSDSPLPQRRQSGVWIPNNVPPNIMDPQVQQQVAQVIYMQTMLAMQAAGAADACNVSPYSPGPQNTKEVTKPSDHSSATTNLDQDPSSPIHNYTLSVSENTSYKCTDCTRCFKDPDVFTLHKRSHIKNDLKPSESVNGKENFNMNNSLTLQANPILANLLTNNQRNNIFDINLENHVMTALAVNMESYMRNLSSLMMKRDDHDDDDEDCDSNLNESLESNKLVIDESV